MPAPDLEGPGDVPELAYLVQWFAELSSARGSTGFGILPISYSEIDAWARLSGTRPTSWEVALLRRLDSAFISSMNRG